MDTPYRTSEPRLNWYVIECGPGWAEVVLDEVTEVEARTYVAGTVADDYGVTHYARCAE